MIRRRISLVVALSSIAFLVAAASCSPKPPAPPIAVDCPAACERGRQLHCLANDGVSPEGKSCEATRCSSILMTPALASCQAHAADCPAYAACAKAGP